MSEHEIEDDDGVVLGYDSGFNVRYYRVFTNHGLTDTVYTSKAGAIEALWGIMQNGDEGWIFETVEHFQKKDNIIENLELENLK